MRTSTRKNTTRDGPSEWERATIRSRPCHDSEDALMNLNRRGKQFLIAGTLTIALLSLASAYQASLIPSTRLINPDELVKVLQSSKGEKPLMIQVGSHVLFSQAHIPGSEYIGPASSESGLQQLRPAESSALRAAIAGIVAAGEGAMRVPMAISRDAGRPLQVVVAPLPATTPGMHRQPAAVLLITDTSGKQECDRDLLQRTFSLSHAEARVASALTRGQNLEEIALALQVRVGTIRTHLKRLFAKTGTLRQGELISLLLTLGARETFAKTASAAKQRQ